MEINLNGNFNVARDFGAIQSQQAQSAQTKAASQQSSALGVRASEVDVLRQSEPVMDVPESALKRDDELGRLVNRAFNLPPPPMPDFAQLG